MRRSKSEGCPNCDGTGRPSCPMCGGTNVPFPEEIGPDFKKILREFVQDIDATGGIFRYEGTESCAPVGAKDWTDLGETYLKACKALGRRPHKEVSDEKNHHPSVKKRTVQPRLRLQGI